MAEQLLYQFRLFFRDTPTMFAGWRAYDHERRWDRHYLLANNMSLRIERGERVELTRWAMHGHFAVETTVLSSAFPLDWMALSCITRSLPRDHRLTQVDGRTPQTFVDSLAQPGLAQASVLKNERYLREGAVLATSSRIEIPDWNVEAITMNLTCHHRQSLQLALEAVEMDRYQHLGFDDWMSNAHAKAFPEPTEPDKGTGSAPAAEPSATVETGFEAAAPAKRAA